MFTVKMETDNAAFEGGDDDYGAGPEVARILRGIASVIDEAGTNLAAGVCVDFNGNRVGRWELS